MDDGGQVALSPASPTVLGRTLDEVIAAMSAERQARIKARAAELQVEAEAYAAAEERGRVAAQTEPRAALARYDRRRGRMVIVLTNGCTFTFPPRLVQGLETATDDEIAEVELLGVGSGLHWERLDVDISVSGLLAGRFGSRKWMARQLNRGSELADPDDIDLIERAFPPGDERPHLDVPRFWSNPSLRDPDTIIALVLDKPTTEDLARTVVSYGPRRVIAMLEKLSASSEMSPQRLERARNWLGPIIKGVADAARELSGNEVPGTSKAERSSGARDPDRTA